MFWSNMTSREEIAHSDDSDDSSEYYERRRPRNRRDSNSSRAWFPSLFGAPQKIPKSPAKKSRRKDRNRSRYCKPRTSRGWGLLFLGVLLVVYLLNFFQILRQNRPGSRLGFRRSVSHQIRHYPPVANPPATQPRPIAQPPPQDHKPQPVSITETIARVQTPPPSALVNQASAVGPAAAAAPIAAALPPSSPMDTLMVGANIGTLTIDAVKSQYRRLAQHYLSTFSGGIYRHLFFEVLRRRTYSMTPPGANKGIQCILFQIINKKVYMMDPYEVPRNSKPFYRTRINEVIWILSRLAEQGRIRDTEFLMAIHDCVQTVNKPHTYRGAHHQESNPTFTIVSCNFSNNIPFPMWEGSGRDGGFVGWDEYTRAYASDATGWDEKRDIAVFRGSNRPSMYFRNKEDAEQHCDDVGRLRLMHLSRTNPGYFDVSVGGQCGGKRYMLRRMSPGEHHNFKYILYVEGNCMWADRLRHQVFGPSVILKQETPCRQFFEPLISPMTHYIPTDFFLTDTVRQIEWARANDEKVQQIVRNANEFAANFLSLNGIEAYVEVLLDEYTKLLVEPDIKLENGAVEVTNRRV